MVIVDTTVWVDYLRGARNPETEWLELEADRKRIGLTDLILCEVLEGVRGEPMKLRHREIAMQVGLFLLAILMAFVIVNDISRLIG